MIAKLSKSKIVSADYKLFEKKPCSINIFNTSKITQDLNRVRAIHSNKSIGSFEVGQYIRNPLFQFFLF